ncbi:MAG TPA: T9SS type A sorting domain-containing protein [Bacteroidota bacterium]|jgi:hypothetical protein
MIHRICIPIALLICVATQSTQAQYFQQGPKLVGTGSIGTSYQGHHVSISGDGNVALVGGYADNGASGATWAYERVGGVWSQIGSKLLATDAVYPSRQGVSVSLATDGSTAIIGGYVDNGGVGASWIYKRIGGVWVQQGNKLIGTGAAGNAWQGVSVAISGDGNTVITGGYNDSNYRGAAWVYTQSGGVWTQQGSKLVGADDAGSAFQGESVSLSDDGNTAIVSGSHDSSFTGATWAYIRVDGVWHQQGGKLVGSGGVGGGQQGVNIALSADGNTAIVGGYLDDGGKGAAWVFTRTAGVWSQQRNKLVGSGAIGLAQLGRSVSISADGNTAVAGAPLDNGGIGAAFVFKRSAGVWSQYGNKLIGVGGNSNSNIGNTVDISADASTIIVGGEYDNNQVGAAWVFSTAQTSFDIVSVSDIPSDQGKQVRIKWQKSPFDASGAIPQILSYSIWRQSSSGSNRTAKKRDLPEGLLSDSTLLNYDYVTSVPAIQLRQYQTVVPTLEDSTASGIHRFIFRVAAHTSDPNVYFVSLPDSGYSVDNLAPANPSGLSATQIVAEGGGEVVLSWAPNLDPDFDHFDVYRSTTPNFDPKAGQPIATVTNDQYFDPDVSKGAEYYYKVSASDHAGNESGYSNEVNIIVAGVNDQNGIPDRYSLGQNYPNPFNPSSIIEYALPGRGFVSLKVFNMLGVEVATLVQEEESPGYKSIRFDASGLPGGVYLYRLTAGNFTESKKMVLIK